MTKSARMGMAAALAGVIYLSYNNISYQNIAHKNDMLDRISARDACSEYTHKDEHFVDRKHLRLQLRGLAKDEHIKNELNVLLRNYGAVVVRTPTYSWITTDHSFDSSDEKRLLDFGFKRAFDCGRALYFIDGIF